MARRKLTRSLCPSPRQVDTVSARELEIFIDNESPLRRKVTSVFSNLKRKKNRGTYDSSKAPQAFSWVVTEGAKDYAREYSSSARQWNTIFPKKTRDYVACNYADEFEAEYSVGALGQSNGGLGVLAWLGIGLAIAGTLHLVGTGLRQLAP